jgi:hypothetical protein
VDAVVLLLDQLTDADAVHPGELEQRADRRLAVAALQP